MGLGNAPINLDQDRAVRGHRGLLRNASAPCRNRTRARRWAPTVASGACTAPGRNHGVPSRPSVCLTKKGDHAAAKREQDLASHQRPTTYFDNFLVGTDDYRQGRTIAALEHFNDALHQRPDHFWAQCLSAVCMVQLQRPLEAFPRLNACLQREPKFAWLYMLRGIASSQFAGQILIKLKETRAAANDHSIDKAKRQLNLETQQRLEDQAKRQLMDVEDDFRQALDLLDNMPNDDLRYALLVDRALLLRLQRTELDMAAEDLRARSSSRALKSRHTRRSQRFTRRRRSRKKRSSSLHMRSGFAASQLPVSPSLSIITRAHRRSA